MLLPETILQSLSNVKDFDSAAFQEAHLHPPATSIRLHPAKQANLPFEQTIPVPWCQDGIYLSERPVFTLDPLFHAGSYYVQEASSMFLDHAVKQLFPDRDHLRVLDLCAAPGGKSTLLASLLGEKSLLISNEVIRSRATILEENAVRWGYSNNWVSSNDPKDFGKLSGYFDLIVVDAPCSGSGLFRKDEKALENWSQANVLHCAARQKRILADVWDSLKEDGVLIYATCSYSPEEDEEIIDWINDELGAAALTVPLKKDWNIVESISPKNHFPCYRFFPDKVRGEGFFIAAIRKNRSAPSLKAPKARLAPQEKVGQLSKTILEDKDWSFIETGEGWQAFLKDHETDYLQLKTFLYLRKTGVTIGNFTPKEWIPHHELAMSIDKHSALQTVDVNRETALRFLKKEDTGNMELPKGWYLVTYQGLSLGWIKSIGSRNNNYLPKNWRIRMELPPEDQA